MQPSFGLARRLLLGIFIALLVSDGLSFGAQAYTTQTWNTTALFNGGTKASTSTATDTCENVTANALALNNTGNYQGIGLTTGTSTCATGAWGVSPSGLVLSYDMQTLTAGKMKDFSGNGNVGTLVNANDSTGIFGRARAFDGSTSYMSTSLGNSASWSMSAWVRLDSAGNYPMIISSSTTGIRFGNGASKFPTVSTQNVTLVSDVAVVLGVWYLVTGTYDGVSVRLYVNTTLKGGPSIATSGSIANAYIGRRVDGFFMKGAIDELLVFSRALSLPDITRIYTDGRSSFLSSGSWTSPNVAFTTAPAFVTITGSGFTSSNRPSRLRFLSSSGTVVFDTLVPSGLASPIQIPVNLTFNPAQWSVRLDMIGNGTATAKMISIAVTLGVAPLFQNSDILFLFGMALLLLGVICLFPESPEFPLISIVAGLLFIAWTFLFFSPTLGGGVYLVMGLGIGALLTVLGIGRFLAEATA